MTKHRHRTPVHFSNIREYLSFDPETGSFTWVKDPGYRRVTGTTAGKVGSRGYMVIQFGRKEYHAHRLAWFFVHGDFPSLLIDHINGVKHDNRLSNLRLATDSQNQMNRRPNRGRNLPKGVHLDEGRYRSEIKVNGKRVSLGSFRSAREAAHAYRAAALKYHGEFARTE